MMPAWALHQQCLPAPHGAAGHDRVPARNIGNWELERQRQELKPKSQVCLPGMKPQAHLAARGRRNTVTGGGGGGGKTAESIAASGAR